MYIKIDLLFRFLVFLKNILYNRYSFASKRALQRAQNLILVNLTNKNINYLMNSCINLGKKPSHILDLGIKDSINEESFGLEKITIEEVKKLESYCIVIEWDGLNSTTIAEILYAKGYSNILYSQWLGEVNESENIKQILKNLMKIWSVLNLLHDEESRKTYLSTLEIYCRADFSRLNMAVYNQYEHPIVQAIGDDVIIDGGAYDGISSLSFTDKLNADGKVYAFEPVTSNYEKMLVNFEKFNEKRCIGINAGLGKERVKCVFHEDGAGSFLEETNEKSQDSIEIVNIDYFVEKENININLLKLDIEGFELDCLEGAKKTIVLQLPKLQICLYHRLTDFWKIPLLIKEFSGQYRFFVGHHYIKYSDEQLHVLFNEKQREINAIYNCNGNVKHHIETVLYAIVK